MAFENKTGKEKTRQAWVQERKEIAKQQLLRIRELTNALFSSEDLTDFLRLLSRIPYYSYQNLLIIHEKYPSATLLAVFPIWQRLMAAKDPSQRVLKPEAVKKGIDIIVPFTNAVGEHDYELTWYSILVFDIQQTNVKDFSLMKSAYIQDQAHQGILLDAITSVLGERFGRRVVYEAQNSTLLSPGQKGRISKHNVTVARGQSEDKVLSWLTEAVCELELQDDTLSPRSRLFLLQCIQFCLYHMWSLPHPGILPDSHTIVPSSDQEAFLNLLQKTVFSLHQKVAGTYQAIRQDAQIGDDID